MKNIRLLNFIKIIDTINYWLFVALVFSTPLFFLPTTFFSVFVGKQILTILIASVIIILWIIARLIDGMFILPRKGITFSILAFVLVYGISSYFSTQSMVSFSGQFFESDTFVFIYLLSALFLILPSYLHNEKRLRYISYAIISSITILDIFHLGRIFFNGSTLTIVGKWNDFSILSATSLLLVLGFMSIRSSVHSKKRNLFLNIFGTINLIAVCLSNFLFVWVVLALLSTSFVILIGYRNKKNILSSQHHAGHVSGQGPFVTQILSSYFPRQISVLAIVTVLVSVLFSIDQIIPYVVKTSTNTTQTFPITSNFISNTFKVSNVEAVPTIKTGIQVASDVMGINVKNALIGIGPHRFFTIWQSFKPKEVNLHPVFWNVDYSFSSSWLLTIPVTTGAIGFGFLLIVIALYVYRISSAYIKLHTEKGTQVRPYIFSFLFIGIFTCIYIPSEFVLVITVVLGALLLAVSHMQTGTFIRTYNMLASRTRGIIICIILFLLLISNLYLVWFLSNKTTAVIKAQQGYELASTQKDLTKAESLAIEAATLDMQDSYVRLLSQINLAQASTLIKSFNNTGSATLATSSRQKVVDTVKNAIGNSFLATKIDPLNYQNWLNVGALCEGLLGLDKTVKDFHDCAEVGYKNSIITATHDPFLDLTLARFYRSVGDITKAESYGLDALDLKQNYVEDLVFLGDISIEQKKYDLGINYLSDAVAASAGNPQVLYVYARALYIRGGEADKIKAISILQYLADSFPKNEEIKTVLEQIKTSTTATNASSSVKTIESKKVNVKK